MRIVIWLTQAVGLEICQTFIDALVDGVQVIAVLGVMEAFKLQVLR